MPFWLGLAEDPEWIREHGGPPQALLSRPPLTIRETVFYRHYQVLALERRHDGDGSPRRIEQGQIAAYAWNLGWERGSTFLGDFRHYVHVLDAAFLNAADERPTPGGDGSGELGDRVRRRGADAAGDHRAAPGRGGEP